MDVLNIIGSVSSIIGLVITFLVFLGVSHIRAYYNLIGRVPDLTSQLKKQAAEIINLTQDYSNNISNIDLELAKTEPILVRLEKQLGRKNISPVKNIIDLVDDYRRAVKYRNASGLVENVRHIYTEMQKVLIEITELQKDAKWEKVG